MPSSLPRPFAPCAFAPLALALPLLAPVAHAQPSLHADGGGPPAPATAACSTATLRGTYGFSVRGTTDAASTLPPALQGPFAAVGTTSYDGRGGVTITARSASFNGLIQAVPAEQGRYSVSRDCVVTAAYPSGVTTRGVIVDGGRGMFAIQTNAGTTIGGWAARRDAHRAAPAGARAEAPGRGGGQCTAAGLAGRYGFFAEGFAGPPTLPIPAAVPLVGNGVVTLSAGGSFSSQALRSVGGVPDPQALSLPGRFTVGPDCAVQMNFDVGFHFAGTVVDGGREILFVETDPGTSLVVRARRQD